LENGSGEIEESNAYSWWPLVLLQQVRRLRRLLTKKGGGGGGSGMARICGEKLHYDF
jgi:hypothetical protein